VKEVKLLKRLICFWNPIPQCEQGFNFFMFWGFYLKGAVALESPLSCSDVLKHTREIRSSWFNGINLCACFYVCDFARSNSIGCPCRRTWTDYLLRIQVYIPFSKTTSISLVLTCRKALPGLFLCIFSSLKKPVFSKGDLQWKVSSLLYIITLYIHTCSHNEEPFPK